MLPGFCGLWSVVWVVHLRAINKGGAKVRIKPTPAVTFHSSGSGEPKRAIAAIARGGSFRANTLTHSHIRASGARHYKTTCSGACRALDGVAS